MTIIDDIDQWIAAVPPFSGLQKISGWAFSSLSLGYSTCTCQTYAWRECKMCCCLSLLLLLCPVLCYRWRHHHHHWECYLLFPPALTVLYWQWCATCRHFSSLTICNDSLSQNDQIVRHSKWPLLRNHRIKTYQSWYILGHLKYTWDY